MVFFLFCFVILLYNWMINANGWIRYAAQHHRRRRRRRRHRGVPIWFGGVRASCRVDPFCGKEPCRRSLPSPSRF